MNHLPHFARFVRALAVGAAVGVATVAACTNTAASEGTNGTTTTNGSSGNESTSSATDAGASASADAEAPTASLDGTPCPTVGERRPDPRDSNSLCACGGSEGSSSWQCAQMPIPIAGPAAPPELAV
ncbi:MAG: hypothetical protein JNK05_23045 [Myxococcales bacterium]|nr:hypothetical protein [Myxococcales bacterium]